MGIAPFRSKKSMQFLWENIPFLKVFLIKKTFENIQNERELWIRNLKN